MTDDAAYVYQLQRYLAAHEGQCGMAQAWEQLQEEEARLIAWQQQSFVWGAQQEDTHGPPLPTEPYWQPRLAPDDGGPRHA